MVTVLIVVIVGLLTLLFYSYTSQYISRKMATITQESLDKVIISFNGYMEDVYYSSIQLQSDELFVALLNDDGYVDKRINSEVQKNAWIDSIYVFRASTNSIITSNSINSKVYNQNYKDIPWIKHVMASGKDSEMYYIIGYEDNIGLFKRKYISIAKPLYNELNEFKGILCTNVLESKVKEDLLLPVVKDQKAIYYLVDRAGQVISSNDNGQVYLNADALFNYDKIKTYKKGYYIEENALNVFTSSHFPNYYLVYQIDSKAIIGGLAKLRTSGALLALVAIGIAVIFVSIITNAFYKPIARLKASMKNFESGDFSTRIDEPRQDEFEALYSGFNNMASGVNRLMKKTVKQQTRYNEIKFRTLQTQISPHFIYNTLYSIKCVALIEKHHKISEMLTAFIALLQMSTDNRRDLISLREELRQVENYVSLQKHRYGDAFQVFYFIDESFMNQLVPKLILQPLIENSIKYGIDLKAGNGEVTFTAYDDGEGFVIEIEDRCMAPDMEKIESILSSLEEPSIREIGINNVNRRLKIIYGDAYGLTYKKTDKGIKVEVRIGKTPRMNYNRM